MLLLQIVRLDCPEKRPYYNMSTSKCVKRCDTGFFMNVSATSEAHSMVCVRSC